MSRETWQQTVAAIEAEGARHECVYLPEMVARYRYIYPRRGMTGPAFDAALAEGYRRSGPYLYATNCEACQACQPTRIVVSEFRWSKGMRRAENKGDRCLEVRIGQPTVDTRRVELYNLHRSERHLAAGDEQLTAMDYTRFLLESSCDSREISFYGDQQLIGCSIVDVGHNALSAVYTYFDPRYHAYSIGTYAILKMLRYAAIEGKEFVYLGLYVANNRHLNYKARFLPQQRLIDRQWQAIDREEFPEQKQEMT